MVVTTREMTARARRAPGLAVMSERPAYLAGLDARRCGSLEFGFSRSSGARRFLGMGGQSSVGTRRGRGIERRGSCRLIVTMLRLSVCREIIQTVWATCTRRSRPHATVDERSETARQRRNGCEAGEN